MTAWLATQETHGSALQHRLESSGPALRSGCSAAFSRAADRHCQDPPCAGLPTSFVRHVGAGDRHCGHGSLAATFQLVTPAAERKRPVGQAVPGKSHKQRITAGKANSGYQLKRSALPPLLATEMEPGQAAQAALYVVGPFTVGPALGPDLQEVPTLSLVTFCPGAACRSSSFLGSSRSGAVAHDRCVAPS